MRFEDRRDAGRALAPLVAALPDLNNAIVLALPRGGVPVAFEVARASSLPLDVLIVRKLGAPGMQELAMGAIASGGVVVTNPDVLHSLRISDAVLHARAKHEMPELERRERLYRGTLPPLAIDGHTAILVDDGLATGATMRSAVHAVRPRARRVVIAVPVAAESSLSELESEADEILCLSTPEFFQAVGQYYRNFEATSDEEVCALLKEARAWLRT
ncbi:MAG TPA: phosphoribosyltransferase [Terracidiphilus sp.]|nr:phosphoribosyltransferase [Terracidiphilus sp.]